MTGIPRGNWFRSVILPLNRRMSLQETIGVCLVLEAQNALRYWKELKEVLATQGQRTSPMHNPQFPSFHEVGTQSLFSGHWNSVHGR
jgi:hypothetical protein